MRARRLQRALCLDCDLDVIVRRAARHAGLVALSMFGLFDLGQ
jgi:hypothetical protein